MTADEFWGGTMNDYYAYLFAYNQKQKRQLEYDNYIAYINNSYNILALQQVLQFSKNPKQIYPNKPFDLFDTKKEETDEELSMKWINYMRSKQIK